MFNDFTHRHADCIVDGMADKVILSRASRGRSEFGRQYLYDALFSSTSAAMTGSLLVVGDDSFLVESLRLTVEKDKYCSSIKVNYLSVHVQRKTTTYDSSGNPTGTSWTTVATVPMNIEHVNGNTPYKDGLLLADTVFKLTLQTTDTVQLSPDPDRVVIDGKPYAVSDINLSVIPGLQVVQVKTDTR